MLYLPRAPNALKEVGHPHRKNHRFSQQLFGVLQVSEVIPKAQPETSVSGTKQRTAAAANSTRACATYQCTFGLRDMISLSSASTSSLSYPVPSNFFSSTSPASPAPLFPLWIKNIRQPMISHYQSNCCSPTLSSLALTPRASLNPDLSDLGLA